MKGKTLQHMDDIFQHEDFREELLKNNGTIEEKGLQSSTFWKALV